MILAQILVSARLPPSDRAKLEQATLSSLLFTFAASSIGLQHFGIGSSGHVFISSLSSFAAIFYDYSAKMIADAGSGRLDIAVYSIGQFVPITLGVEVAAALLDIFVPLVSSSRLAGSLSDITLSSHLHRQDEWERYARSVSWSFP